MNQSKLSERDELYAQLSPTYPGTDLKKGDRVTFTNENGVSFPGKTIMGFSERADLPGRVVYIDTDCWWFPKRLHELKKEADDNLQRW